jgi:hypothetical protein
MRFKLVTSTFFGNLVLFLTAMEHNFAPNPTCTALSGRTSVLTWKAGMGIGVGRFYAGITAPRVTRSAIG